LFFSTFYASLSSAKYLAKVSGFVISWRSLSQRIFNQLGRNRANKVGSFASQSDNHCSGAINTVAEQTCNSLTLKLKLPLVVPTTKTQTARPCHSQ